MITAPRLVADPAVDPARYQTALSWFISHCLWPEFPPLWRGGGLAAEAELVRAAFERGDTKGTELIIREQIWPVTEVQCGNEDPARQLLDWIDARVERGVTVIGLPPDTREQTGLTLGDIREHVAGRKRE